MLINFEFGNFRSFRDQQIFSMQASPLRSNDSGDEEGNVSIIENYRLLRTKAIYGANASGKSNLVRALGAFKIVVNQSVNDEDIVSRLWEDRFKLLKNWEDQPIFFELTFLHGKTKLKYGFRVLEGKILDEWLFNDDSKVPRPYFIRKAMNLDINAESFPGSKIYAEKSFSKNNELFREDSLFFTAAALMGNNFIGELRNIIKNISVIDGANDKNALNFAFKYLADSSPEESKLLKDLLRAADTGVEDLIIKEQENTESETEKAKNLSLFSSHSVFDEEGNVFENLVVPFTRWESQGTTKFFGIAALVTDTLRKGNILAIDELDARFHPKLSLKIVDLFNDTKTNPKNAQLIFVTHDTSILKSAGLRRDQICFVTRDKYGISSMRSLVEFKGVRKDASYEKEYLEGAYSGVPFLGEINSLMKQNSSDEL